MGSLENSGYLLIKSALSQKDLDKLDENYTQIAKFINETLFPKITHFKSPKYLKYRYSNNTNGKDASVFHGDVYNHTSDDTIPVFTCLCYKDPSQMQLIPNTHKKSYVKGRSAQELLDSKITLTIWPGDILIFHANLHHRGVGYNKTLNNGQKFNRRILQVFDVFPTEEYYSSYINQFKIVQTGNTLLMKLQAKITGDTTTTGEFMTWLNYNLVIRDMQYRSIMLDIPQSKKNNSLVSYEPGKRLKLSDAYTANYVDNVNVIVDDTAWENSIEVTHNTLFFLAFIIVGGLLFTNRN